MKDIELRVAINAGELVEKIVWRYICACVFYV